jgi:uncharacterized protein YjbI with pentapeptide repeats
MEFTRVELYTLMNTPSPLWLAYADLSGVYLGRAKLARATLLGANLSEVYLGWANLAGATLEGANLKDAKYNKYTKWPADFDPEKAGAKLRP